jgi:asparagine synthase (glutamine-hydrolysing)
MCGIAVAISWDDAVQTVRRLVAGVRHRGDVADPIVSPRPGYAMGTQRLRMFNGEIYNHEALRRELEATGIAFRTNSDTEVLASALRAWGPKALRRINGMYAFVAIDAANGEFLAARDPFGVKPLYVVQSENGFLFCSEIRPLLGACEVGDVLLLPPGHFMTRKSVGKFGAFVEEQAAPRVAHEPAVLDRLLREAVQIRVPRDLPAAVLFSGGVDSTLVVHYVREVRPKVPGYFLGGGDAPDYEYAARYADLTGLDLRCVTMTENSASISDEIDAVVSAAESFEPSMIRDGLCNYRLARRIHSDGYRVALCGEGADELFAGYRPLEIAFEDSESTGRNVREQTLAAMHRTNLQRLDRFGMRFQVELREPFLDPAVVGYALSLPASEMLLCSAEGMRGKAPLRSLWALHREALPTAIRDRRKLAMHVGSGFDQSQKQSPWIDYAEANVSDHEFADGKLRFQQFDLQTKEEYLYLHRLAATLDVSRVPHLTARPFIRMPPLKRGRSAEAALSDFLLAG